MKIRIRTQAGVFVLEMREGRLYSVCFPKTAKRGDFVARLEAVLRGKKLDQSDYTDFQCKVYAVLRNIPVGQTVSYGELAKRAGFPGASRAVGSAMRKNRLPIVIPCHRVIRGDGSLGQYSGGVAWKRALLEFEGVTF